MTASEFAEASCPYCGESVELSVDLGGGGAQSYTEDCSVCCRPWVVQVHEDEDGNVSVNLSREDE